MKELAKPEERKSLPPPDSILVKRAQLGDDKAFAELVRRYEKKVYNICYRILGNVDEASDALQDAFLRAYQFLKKFKGKSSFYTWLYRIATNVCLTRLRKRRSASALTITDTESDESYQRQPIFVSSDLIGDIPDAAQSPERLVRQKQLREALNQAVAELPADFRTVIVLRDFEGLSNREVSKVLNLSVPAVKSRLHRGRLFLRNRLSRYLNNYEQI
ncbi:MAG: sigma-70 family RNA polymerase sigma factor [candidate division WOR-3 bacterium]